MQSVVRKCTGVRADFPVLRCVRALAGAALLWLSQPAAAVEPLPVREVAAGVYVFHGVTAEQDEHNHGAISNLGFIVGSRCVAVIDSGGSPMVGEALLASVRAITPLPVCYVINTHVHPDHVLGNQAFLGEKPEFVGHAKLPLALAARGRNYIEAAERMMGAAGRGLQLVAPTRTVSDEDTLDIGDRVLRLRAWPTAHTDNDLTVLDERSSTLFTGDLLFVGHMPVVDGKLVGWIAVTDELARMKVTHVVSGHGDAGDAWREAFDKQGNYLRALYAQTRAAIRDGVRLSRAVETVGRDQIDNWALSGLFHRRNVTAAYAELEWED
ncbi:MAG: quinoprotein relay system zinc metallohydrolase 2 [Gammaproteobacteria bacterium]|jgi:quinoprotein relay system zinc metallohydrolase 2|nr:quinoprotein relay system zinc metallohydrolase 2 [Gammaproteobacteria bacterium]MBU0771488.1 quinoprotein relay system zinc metallohydrolase 2 [Gammaproteobacteria bacterium]MBU0857434.1 quinoprotein relay system zinc metallohydrolase 2 [Gammaproteobacteria bacterium]MBU1846581.1 quinoprotein relay system zinc metallohydrolase 2 [Gammaproteobacteria bacterium]